MMKRLQKLWLLLLVFMFAVAPVVVLAADMYVTLDGESADIAIVIVDDRSLAPVREMTYLLGGQVHWDEDLRRATLVYRDTTIHLYIDSRYAVVSGEEVILDVPAMIIDGRTHVPIRFVAESFGLDVDFADGTVVLARVTADGHLQLVSFTEVVQRGTDATLVMIGRPYAEYVATVIFRTGPSTAGGLGAATADTDGNVYWIWRIGSNTTPGTYVITIAGDGDIFYTYFTVTE